MLSDSQLLCFAVSAPFIVTGFAWWVGFAFWNATAE